MKKIASARKDLFYIAPERLTLVYDKTHPLYDPRVENEAAESMIENIAMHGVLEPILVRMNGRAVEIVVGRGRTKAMLELNRRLARQGLPPMLMPCLHKQGTDGDLVCAMVSENELRRGDTVAMKREKARRLLALGYKIKQIAATFGVSRQAVEKWLNGDAPVEEGQAAAEAEAKPKMKTRKEILAHLDSLDAEESEFWAGYVAALNWVLGE